MRRREFLGALSAATALPFAAHAQRPERVRRVGVLMAMAASDPEALLRVKAFESAWPELGWIRGRNIELDYRWAASDLSNLHGRAAELVAATPEVILPVGTPVLAAVRGATQSIPIVFVGVSDPDGTGVVASLARPGGNITGFANFEPTIVGKWVQALKEMAPKLTRVAVLRNPAVLASFRQTIEAVAPSFGMEPVDCGVRTAAEIEQAISAFAGQPNVGLIVVPDPSFTSQRRLIVGLAATHRMPAVYPFRSFASDGGLMAYGVDVADQMRRSASYIDRILKGASPGDLPVQAPIKFELVINLKTARTLGLMLPAPLIARADDLIE